MMPAVGAPSEVRSPHPITSHTFHGIFPTSLDRPTPLDRKKERKKERKSGGEKKLVSLIAVENA